MLKLKLLAYILLIQAGCSQSNPELNREITTREHLRQLSIYSEMILITEKKLPAGGLRGLLQEIGALRGFVTYPNLEAGLDAWGHEFRIDTSDEQTIRFRSDGPNGIGEHGNGDDIQVELKRQLDWRL